MRAEAPSAMVLRAATRAGKPPEEAPRAASAAVATAFAVASPADGQRNREVRFADGPSVGVG